MRLSKSIVCTRIKQLRSANDVKGDDNALDEKGLANEINKENRLLDQELKGVCRGADMQNRLRSKLRSFRTWQPLFGRASKLRLIAVNRKVIPQDVRAIDVIM
jgi:hypothetical protein